MCTHVSLHMRGSYTSCRSYAVVYGSLRASWVEPYFKIMVSFVILCFILHIFKHYSERGIPRLHQIAKGSMVHTHTHTKRYKKVVRELAWGRGVREVGTRGWVRSWKEVFLFFICPFIPLEFSLCVWIIFKKIKEKRKCILKSCLLFQRTREERKRKRIQGESIPQMRLIFPGFSFKYHFLAYFFCFLPFLWLPTFLFKKSYLPDACS